MRHEPSAVDRIAGEPATEMIIDAPLADILCESLHGVKKPHIASLAIKTPKVVEYGGLRKLRGPLEAAMSEIDGIENGLAGGEQRVGRERDGLRGSAGAG